MLRARSWSNRAYALLASSSVLPSPPAKLDVVTTLPGRSPTSEPKTGRVFSELRLPHFCSGPLLRGRGCGGSCVVVHPLPFVSRSRPFNFGKGRFIVIALLHPAARCTGLLAHGPQPVNAEVRPQFTGIPISHHRHRLGSP